MKNVNAAIRKGKTPDRQIPALVALGMSEAQAQELLKPDFCGRIGIAPYSLQNSNANIRRVEQRIREMERAAGKKRHGGAGRRRLHLPRGRGRKSGYVSF